MKMKKCLTVATILVNLVMYSCSKDEKSVAPTEEITESYNPRIANDKSSAYISKVLDLLPAPGQFTNTSIGTDTSGELIIGGNSKFISLGAFGGYVIFSFDHSIQDTTGADLAIYGNPNTTWSEPGIVMVSSDINNNGIPDDPWYELGGSNYDSTTTIKNYSVTYYNPKKYANVSWKDNQGDSGAVLINQYHLQNYYPLFAANQDSITFTGTRLRNTVIKSTLVSNLGFSWGYSDSYSLGLDPNGYDNYKENQYNSFDISWARDSSGKSVQLKYIDFVKVYTGQLADGGWLGEVSTEVQGAADLHILNK